jgi:protein phosphatase
LGNREEIVMTVDAYPSLLSTWRTAGYQGPRTIDADAVAARTDASGGLVAALADGVGDHGGAARAARLAADAAVAVPAADGPVAALLAAHAAVTADPEAGDCVLVVAQPSGRGYRLAWVGDVRAYAWDGRVLLPLTTDHTLAQYFRDRGTVPNPAMEHQVLTSVRTAGPAEYGLASLAIPARLLLTSDGVHKTLSHEAMTAIMRRTADPAAALVAAAREAGTRDNTTAAVVDNVFLPPTTPQPVLPTAA